VGGAVEIGQVEIGCFEAVACLAADVGRHSHGGDAGIRVDHNRSAEGVSHGSHVEAALHGERTGIGDRDTDVAPAEALGLQFPPGGRMEGGGVDEKASLRGRSRDTVNVFVDEGQVGHRFSSGPAVLRMPGNATEQTVVMDHDAREGAIWSNGGAG